MARFDCVSMRFHRRKYDRANSFSSIRVSFKDRVFFCSQLWLNKFKLFSGGFLIVGHITVTHGSFLLNFHDNFIIYFRNSSMITRSIFCLKSCRAIFVGCFFFPITRLARKERTNILWT